MMAPNNVKAEEKAEVNTITKKSSRESHMKNKDDSNINKFQESAGCPADVNHDSFNYKAQKSCVPENSVSTSKGVISRKEHSSNNTPSMCEKSEQETKQPLYGTCTSHTVSESDIQENLCAVEELKKSDIDEEITLKKEGAIPPDHLQENTNTNNLSDSVMRRKERRIMKKKMEKDEKRRQREQEFLKNLLPKEQRVQIVDHNTFQKILKDSESSQNENRVLGLSFDEFPALNVPKNKFKFSTNINQQFSVKDNNTVQMFDRPNNNVKHYTKVESDFSPTHEIVNENEMPRELEKTSQEYKLMKVFDKTLNNAKQHKSVSDSQFSDTPETVHKKDKTREFDSSLSHCLKLPKNLSEHNHIATHQSVHKYEMKFGAKSKSGINGSVRKAGKPPKKRDPIKIDILHCIKLAKVKDSSQDSKKRSHSLEKGSKVKENYLISGNELDSSNPLRSKGKKREQPKKKRLSKLKLVIIQERELKKQLKNLQAQKSLQGTQEKTEGHMTKDYLLSKNPEVKKINSEDSAQKCKDMKAISYNEQSPVGKNNGQGILQRDVNVSVKQQGTNGALQILTDTFTNEEPKLETKNHCVSVVASNNERTVTSLPNVDIDNLQSSPNEQSHSNLITDRCAFTGTQSVSHQGNQEKPCTHIVGLHTRKFRPYCDHMITAEINSSVRSLLQDIVKFHDRQYERDPVKANARRRHVTGLREVLKYLNLKRLKLVIIAPDLELIEGKGGICDIVSQLKEGAKMQEIPHVFALDRKTLGKITFKKVPVSCVGVISYDGTEKNYHALMEALPEARNQYENTVANAVQKNCCSSEDDVNKQVIQKTLSKLTEKGTSISGEQTEEEY